MSRTSKSITRSASKIFTKFKSNYTPTMKAAKSRSRSRSTKAKKAQKIKAFNKALKRETLNRM
jgi:hypothetical protein